MCHLYGRVYPWSRLSWLRDPREREYAPMFRVSQVNFSTKSWRTDQVHDLKFFNSLLILELPRANNSHLLSPWYSASFVCRQNVLWVAHGFLPGGVNISCAGIKNLGKLRNCSGVNSILVSDDNNLVLKECLSQSCLVHIIQLLWAHNRHPWRQLDFCPNGRSLPDCVRQELKRQASWFRHFENRTVVFEFEGFCLPNFVEYSGVLYRPV